MLSPLQSLLGHRNPLRLTWHRVKALAAALRYAFPARRLTVIGITGTDGKTTTVGMVAHILHTNGIAVGALSTASFRVRDRIEWNPTQKTSPSPFLIQRFLRRLVRDGCTHVVLEYSSHGLVQGRMLFTWPTVAAITNTSAEHLDYHGSMEQYRADKGRLFRMLRGRGTKILNVEDETFSLYEPLPSKQTIVYAHQDFGQRTADRGANEGNLWLSDIRINAHGTSATVHLVPLEPPKSEVRSPLSLRIPGLFNLENALCAIGCAHAVGLSLPECTDALQSFTGIPGRMEPIDEGQSFAVYVDFTVTPQAFTKTLTTARQMIEPGKRILVLTGSCGDRMREKRPIVGRLCSELADRVVITDDESYAEDPHTVIEEVWAGVDPSKGRKIFDRREAIRSILKEAKPGDLVLLCGLGSYPSRMTPKGPIPWNEQEIARGILRELAR